MSFDPFVEWNRAAIRSLAASLTGWGFICISLAVAVALLLLWRPALHELRFAARVASAHLKSRRLDKGISAITLISIAGVTVGVMALIMVLSVMAGFETDMRDKILGSNAHVVVLSHTGSITDAGALAEEVEAVPGVNAAAPFIYTEMMLRSPFASSGVILKGIDPVRTPRVTEITRNLKVGPGGLFEDDQAKLDLLANLREPPVALTQALDDKEALAGLILGQELADQLKVYVGDKIHIINPVGGGGTGPFGAPVPKVKPVRVAGIFHSGMFEYDTKWCYIHNLDAREFLGLDGDANGLEVRVGDIYAVNAISKAIEQELGFPYYTRNWQNMNQKLFSALKTEKVVMGLILSLIVLVASLNVVGTLILVVLTRGREIAVLRTMGASSTAVRVVFVLEGLFIGIVGTIAGTVLGLLGCWALDKYKFPLDSEVYFLDSLPVMVEPVTVLFVMFTAVMICFFATLYPATQAATLDPVEGLRYE